MVSVALRISEELAKITEELPWVNWSELAREEALARTKLQMNFERFENIVSKSKLTEEDAEKLARAVKKSMHAKLKTKHPGLL